MELKYCQGGKLSGKAKEKEKTHETRVISMENKQQMTNILLFLNFNHLYHILDHVE